MACASVNQNKLALAAAVTLLTRAVEVTVLTCNATSSLTDVFRGFPLLLQ
jgi:hypothetical protein